jgi:hypothetical protein
MHSKRVHGAFMAQLAPTRAKGVSELRKKTVGPIF